MPVCGCGFVVACRAHAAEPHMSQPRAPEGARAPPHRSSPVWERSSVWPRGARASRSLHP
ncbi:hypothetical protein FNH08_07715 [Streptomyces spongiae]|uniref:Uncharacterized protein n=1 Tax=Streptomyces spongiae TaxID=565072 RepID=A0A5N8XD08_9ACTN|nr:hypothetical protein [Streptomyces spongiae]